MASLASSADLTVPFRVQLRRLADQVVTLAKQGTLLAWRRAGDLIRTEEAMQKLFGVLARRYEDRVGGYTRVLRCRKRRLGDNAPMAYIEYIDRPGELRLPRPPATPVPYRNCLAKALEKKDTELADYYKQLQAQVVAATQARAAKLASQRYVPRAQKDAAAAAAAAAATAMAPASAESAAGPPNA